ncbi:TorD/DmsD family molecular chaperone [Nitratiruptor tergarcus]|uniref:Chaperone TorD involved in molybdoenzyme TorA maturation n=1 Tax=Nitratiruptor tergarcus DSM 16512 TaxID=1069081 RepID=A0A1W1WU33_9BACT|nr:molecular chaperone TorD family protein [Nitratiruptor tergarcus]SMC09253.1 chaperone TorD involved in molybdoenzyme TorA maturation [Nitratiruptor tergarcus DSM 16512]
MTHSRNAMYGLISRIFVGEMDDLTLATIEKLPNFQELFPHYYEWRERQNKSRYKLINEVLNVDFTDIAVLHLIPYETFYTREDGMIESGGANPVLQVYNDLGFRVDYERARVVSPDHIGVELEFMKLLTEAQQKAEEENDEEAVQSIKAEQKKFLENHLLQFAPMYFINVVEQARTPFYKDAAKLALEFLLEDYEYLSEEIA